MTVSAKDVCCSFFSSASESSWPLLSSGSEMDYCDHTRCYNFIVQQNTNSTSKSPVLSHENDSYESLTSSDEDSLGLSETSDSSPDLKSMDQGGDTTPSKPILIARELTSPSTKVRPEVVRDFFATKAKVQSVAIHNTMIPLCNHWFPDINDILLQCKGILPESLFSQKQKVTMVHKIIPSRLQTFSRMRKCISSVLPCSSLL